MFRDLSALVAIVVFVAAVIVFCDWMATDAALTVAGGV